MYTRYNATKFNTQSLVELLSREQRTIQFIHLIQILGMFSSYSNFNRKHVIDNNVVTYWGSAKHTFCRFLNFICLKRDNMTSEFGPLVSDTL